MSSSNQEEEEEEEEEVRPSPFVMFLFCRPRQEIASDNGSCGSCRPCFTGFLPGFDDFFKKNCFPFFFGRIYSSFFLWARRRSIPKLGRASKKKFKKKPEKKQNKNEITQRWPPPTWNNDAPLRQLISLGSAQVFLIIHFLLSVLLRFFFRFVS